MRMSGGKQNNESIGGLLTIHYVIFFVVRISLYKKRKKMAKIIKTYIVFTAITII